MSKVILLVRVRLAVQTHLQLQSLLVVPLSRDESLKLLHHFSMCELLLLPGVLL